MFVHFLVLLCSPGDNLCPDLLWFLIYTHLCIRLEYCFASSQGFLKVTREQQSQKLHQGLWSCPYTTLEKLGNTGPECFTGVTWMVGTEMGLKGNFKTSWMLSFLAMVPSPLSFSWTWRGSLCPTQCMPDEGGKWWLWSQQSLKSYPTGLGLPTAHVLVHEETEFVYLQQIISRTK